MLTAAVHSQRLLHSLAALERGDTGGKIALVSRASELMPGGSPAYTEVARYPMIAQLIKEHGRQSMMAAVFVLVKDFCGSLNVVRNMNEDQMIEAAAMLLDECGNFRLEDYVMMFGMAKRGNLVKILDRVDIQVIGQMIDAYWEKRNAAGNRAQEESLKPPPVQIPADAKMADPEKVSAFFKEFAAELKNKLMADSERGEDAAEEIRRQQMNQRRRAVWEGKEPDEMPESVTAETPEP